MQKVIDECQNRKESKSDIRLLFRNLDKFALELDIIPKGYADFSLGHISNVGELGYIPTKRFLN